MIDNTDKMNGEVRLSGRLVCASEQEVKVVRDHLAEHVRLTREEAGCISFDISATDDRLIWHVEECFRDIEAFKHHQQRTRASVWWTATASITREFKVTGLK